MYNIKTLEMEINMHRHVSSTKKECDSIYRIYGCIQFRAFDVELCSFRTLCMLVST